MTSLLTWSNAVDKYDDMYGLLLLAFLKSCGAILLTQTFRCHTIFLWLTNCNKIINLRCMKLL